MPAREPHQSIQGDLFDTLARLFTGKPRTRRSTPETPRTGENGIPRTITLDGNPLAYRLRRSARRTIGFVIDETWRDCHRPHTLHHRHHRRRHPAQTPLDTKQNRPLPATKPHQTDPAQLGKRQRPALSGQPLTIAIEPAAVRRIAIHIETDHLRIRIPATAANPPELGAHLQKWLKTQAQTLLAGRLEHYAAKMNVRYDTFRLSNARTRWGSCSAKRHIRLNWRLIHCDLTLIDYVAIHELAHLTEMNHGPRFWPLSGNGTLPPNRHAKACANNPHDCSTCSATDPENRHPFSRDTTSIYNNPHHDNTGDIMRFLHTMLRVGDLNRSIDFYTRVMGMKLIRTTDNPEYKYTLAYLGYAANPEQAELELTYNYGVSQYDMGTAYGHIALSTDDIVTTCNRIREAGGKITREPGPVKGGTTVIAFLEDPDGYKIELIEQKD